MAQWDCNHSGNGKFPTVIKQWLTCHAACYWGSYVDEFDFRYNNREAPGVNDEERAAQVTKGLGGKRLT